MFMHIILAVPHSSRQRADPLDVVNAPGADREGAEDPISSSLFQDTAAVGWWKGPEDLALTQSKLSSLPSETNKKQDVKRIRGSPHTECFATLETTVRHSVPCRDRNCFKINISPFLIESYPFCQSE